MVYDETVLRAYQALSKYCGTFEHNQRSGTSDLGRGLKRPTDEYAALASVLRVRAVQYEDLAFAMLPVSTVPGFAYSCSRLQILGPCEINKKPCHCCILCLWAYSARFYKI
jgi:hypothetical protein